MAISAPVLVGSDTGTAGYPAVVTVDTAAAAATTLILKMSLRDNGGGAETVVTVSDTAGNTWVRSVFGATATGITKCQLWRSSNNLALAVNDTITISVSGAAATDNWAAEAYYVDGLDLSTPGDGSNSATGASTTPASGNITTTNADDILLGAVAVAGDPADGAPTQDGDYLPSSGFQIISGGAGVAARRLIRGYRIVSATETNNYAPALAVSRTWVALVGAFKAAAAGGQAVPAKMQSYRRRRAA